MKRTLVAVILAIGPLALGLAPQIHAQDDAEKVRKTVDGTVTIEQETQGQLDSWAEEKAALLARYETAKASVAYLEQRVALEKKEVDALETAIADLRRRLDESDRLNASLQDTLNAVVGELDEWIQRDLPFLAEERQDRIQALKDEMAKPDVTGAEKLRRVLEALQIEANYGGTVEVHQDRITVAGETLFVDLLRIGRISVFWRTPDGQRTGEFDRATGAWVELPSKYARNIGMAMEMASRMRPVELVALPLGRIVP